MKHGYKEIIAFAFLWLPLLLASPLLSVGDIANNRSNQAVIKETVSGDSAGRGDSGECQDKDVNESLKAEIMQKTQTLQVPFIANNGQMDKRVKFYAKTFGGTVFVTKEGEIVYALPANSSELRVQGSECRGEWHSPNGIHDKAEMLHDHHILDIVHPASWIVARDSKSEFNNNREDSSLRNPHYETDPKSAIQNDAVCHPECNEGSLVLKRDSSPLAQNDREELEFHNPLSYFSGVSIREALIGAVSPLKRGEKGVCNKTPNPNDRNETHPRPLLIEGSSETPPRPLLIEGSSGRTTGDSLSEGRTGIALREEFVGARVKAIQGEDPSVTKVSYFKGKDSSKWKTNISTYDAVNLGEIYDGIELKLRAYGNNVEKLFCVRSGADPEKIKIGLNGIRSLKVNKEGLLEAETGLGTVKFTKPVAYQEISGKRVEVECKYTIADCGMQNAECKTNLKSKMRNSNCEIKNLQSENPKSAIQNQKFEYGFAVASFDRTKDLIIDPLLASTYLGGPGSQVGYSLILDTSGNVYVTGYTLSTYFPTTLGAYDTSFNDDYYSDVFVSKLDGGLTSLLASTYMGGSDSDYGYSLTLDTNGNVYVTGYTYSTDFPTTSGAYDNYGGGSYYDAFVSRLNSDLTALSASTYLGGV